MKQLALIIALVSVAACGGKHQSAAPAEATPVAAEGSGAGESPAVMTADDCTAKGGQVRGDIGDGKIACAEGEQELGRVSQGIEGAICCTAGETPAP